MTRIPILLLCLLAVSPTDAADTPKVDDEWPQFLGPKRNGISAATSLNLDWQTKPPKVRWKASIGSGFSSVSFAGRRLFTMAERDRRQYVLCLDADTGKEKWAREVAPGYIDRQRQGPGPRSTPTVHGDRLYCLLPMGELCCLKAEDGAEVWKTNIFKDTGADNHTKEKFYWGMAGSPLIDGDVVIVQPGGNKGNSIAGYDRNTGKRAWMVGDDPPAYGSPITITAGGQRMVVSFTGSALVGVEPVKGTLLWRFPLGNKFDTNCVTPLWLGDRFFVSSAYGAGSVLLDLTVDGSQVKVREKWQTRQLQNQMATSMILDGAIYGCHGDVGLSMLRCIDLATGKQKWSERSPGKCTLIAAAKHLFCLSENGTLRLIEANPERYILKGQLKVLDGPQAWATPALWDRKLYIRDPKSLACIDLAK